jgi:hypothetical protein
VKNHVIFLNVPRIMQHIAKCRISILSMKTERLPTFQFLQTPVHTENLSKNVMKITIGDTILYLGIYIFVFIWYVVYMHIVTICCIGNYIYFVIILVQFCIYYCKPIGEYACALRDSGDFGVIWAVLGFGTVFALL